MPDNNIWNWKIRLNKKYTHMPETCFSNKDFQRIHDFLLWYSYDKTYETYFAAWVIEKYNDVRND